MPLTKLNATFGLTGTLPAVSGANLTGISAGITMVDNWRLTTDFTGSANPVASNWERNDTSPSVSYYGSQMTESSGIFSFPSTGIYLIIFNCGWAYNGDSQYNGVEIAVTSNNSSYVAQAVNYTHIKNVSSPTYTMLSTSATIDVTDTSNIKARFRVVSENSSVACKGDSSFDQTFARFIRLGDT